jgi:hypothetical protein
MNDNEESDREKVGEDNMGIEINIPRNNEEAIKTGTELGHSLFHAASRMRDSMKDGGATSQLSGNAILHGYIVALSYITTVILYEMEGASMPSFEELDARNRPIFKKLVDSVGDIIANSAKRGHFIRVNKEENQEDGAP